MAIRKHTDFFGRFYAKVQPHESGCHLWTGAIHSEDGYGYFGIGQKPTKRSCHAHRVAWEIHHRQEIPTGLQIDHLCRVRACVNPAHLEVVTQKENSRRSPGRGGRWRLTHCMRGHLFDVASTRIAANGTRHCKICTQMRDVGRYARRKQKRL